MKQDENYCVVTRVLGAGILEKTNRNECVLICQSSEKRRIAATAATAQRKMLSSYGGAEWLRQETSGTSTAFVKEQGGLICKPGAVKRWTEEENGMFLGE
jgi:hypothetical protein